MQAGESGDKRLWEYRWVQDLLVIGGIWLLLYLCFYFQAVLMPVFVALVLAYLFDPLLTYCETKWKWRRSWTALSLILLLTLLFIGLAVWLWPIALTQTRAFAQKLPSYLRATAEGFGIDMTSLNMDVTTWIQKLENPQELLGDVFNHSRKAFNYVGIALGVTTTIILNAVLIPLYFYFFATYFPHGVHIASQFVPVTAREKVADVAGKMNRAVSEFFRGRLVVSGIMIVMYSIGWTMTDVPYSILLGTLAGIMNIIPYASGIFWPLAVLVKYIDIVSGHGGDLTFMSVVFWPSLVFLVIQFFEGWILTPWIQSGQLDMSVPTVLIVVFMGGAIGGMMGLLLCIPIAACLKILYVEVFHRRIIRWVVDH